MNLFPAVDVIPLPAPVWLFKVLHILTLALHFVAMQMMLGGILVAAWLNFRRKAGSVQGSASFSMARRLPVVMTYVINLGVPPLLFAQVLYGRALYTSSVLIGVYWISVIVLLTICYWMLYQFSARVEAGQSGWKFGLGAWLLAGAIAKIYNMNMTLMLRPEVWNDMYSKSAKGIILPTGDPTMMRRWLFMLVGGLVAAGLWMIWLAGRKQIEPAVRDYLAKTGGRLALAMILLQGLLGWLVFQAQPEAVRSGLTGALLYKVSGLGWVIMAVVIFLVGAGAGVGKGSGAVYGWVAAMVGFLSIACMTLFRDGIRDLTLGLSKFDVWDRRVTTNWSVVVTFLVLFVLGLAVIGWLISVMVRAKPVSEKVV